MSPYGFVQNICWVEGVPASLASCFSVESLSGKSSGFFRPSLRPLWADGEKDLEGGGWGMGAAIVSLAASTGMGLPRGNDRYPVPAFPPSSVTHEIMRQVRVVAGLQTASLSLQESAPLGRMERLFQARTWLKAPQKTSGKASAPGLLLWDPAQPPRPSAAATDASGHTHRLLVPARLAGVLEASKLAIPGGPAILVNDALLGRGRGWLHQRKAEQQTRSVPFYPSTPPPRLRVLQTPPHSTAMWTPAPQYPHPPGRAGPSPTQGAWASALQDADPVHTMASVCSPRLTYPGRGARRLGAISKQSRWI